MWTLIIIFAVMQGNTSGNSGSVSVEHVPGFSTQQACVNAGNFVQSRAPRDVEYGQTVKTTTLCVSKDV